LNSKEKKEEKQLKDLKAFLLLSNLREKFFFSYFKMFENLNISFSSFLISFSATEKKKKKNEILFIILSFLQIF
jgi:hypothetical protein